jgi:hypothetical protein
VRRSTLPVTNDQTKIFMRNKFKYKPNDSPASGRAEDALKQLKGITWAIPSRTSRPGKRILEKIQNITTWHRRRPPGTLNCKGVNRRKTLFGEISYSTQDSAVNSDGDDKASTRLSKEETHTTGVATSFGFPSFSEVGVRNY